MAAPVIGGRAIVLAAALVWRFSPESSVPPAETSATVPSIEAPLPQAVEPPPVGHAVAPAPADVAGHEAPPRAIERAPLPGELPQTPMAALVTERQNLIAHRDGAGPAADAAMPDIVAGELEFAAEPIDSAWASAAEADVLAKLAQMPGLKLIDLKVECRSTLCRIELTQPSDGALDGRPLSFDVLRDTLALEPRWMMMVGNGSTALRSVGYFWRDGFAPQREGAEPQRQD